MSSTWVVPRVWVSGERVSAAKMNEISTDLTVLYPHTTGGDIAYRDPAGDYLSRLAKGNAWELVYSDGSKPAYASLATIAQNTALVAGQSKGKIICAWNASSLVALGTGPWPSVLTATDPPSFQSIIYSRKGGSSTNWATGGTNGYAPTNSLFQSGATDVTVTSGSGSASISFGSSYPYTPIIMVGLFCSSSRRLIHRISAVSTTGFDITINDLDNLSATVTVFWMAIGAGQ